MSCPNPDAQFFGIEISPNSTINYETSPNTQDTIVRDSIQFQLRLGNTKTSPILAIYQGPSVDTSGNGFLTLDTNTESATDNGPRYTYQPGVILCQAVTSCESGSVTTSYSCQSNNCGNIVNQVAVICPTDACSDVCGNPCENPCGNPCGRDFGAQFGSY